MRQPYFQSPQITLYHGDCSTVLPHLDADSVDLVLTDPPYAAKTHQGARSNPRNKTKEAQALINFDAVTFDQLQLYFQQIARVARSWVIATVDWRHIYHLEQDPPEGLRFVRFGVWIKPNGAPQFSGDRPATGWEGIAILHKADKKMKWNGGGHRAVYTHCIDSSGVHPTAKPLPLLNELIHLYSNPGDLILDPFTGSGGVLRAAADCGRRAIGVEIDSDWCQVATRRCQQLTIFDALQMEIV